MNELFIISNIFIILLCLFVVLTERKLLAHAQRRFGPSIAGRNGWLQILVDLVKLATKEFFILPQNSNSIIPLIITLFFAVQLIFIQNFIFGPNMFLFNNVNGLIFYHIILVIITNILLILIGFLSKSKYSIIGVIRGIVHVVAMDIFVTVVYVLIVLSNQSGNFNELPIIQYNFYFLILFSPLSFGFLIIMLLESKRAPFDHVETEAEVVAGYATEHGGIFLLVFYLCEYMHLIIAANHFSIFFLGGWSYINFNQLLNIFFFSFNDINYYYYIF